MVPYMDTFASSYNNIYEGNNNNSPKVEPFVSASECVVWSFVLWVVGIAIHAEACVYTYVYDTVVYVRSVPSFVLRTNKSGLKYIFILKSFRQ